MNNQDPSLVKGQDDGEQLKMDLHLRNIDDTTQSDDLTMVSTNKEALKHVSSIRNSKQQLEGSSTTQLQSTALKGNDTQSTATPPSPPPSPISLKHIHTQSDVSWATAQQQLESSFSELQSRKDVNDGTHNTAPPSPPNSSPPVKSQRKKYKSEVSWGTTSSHRKPRSQIGSVYRIPPHSGGSIILRPASSTEVPPGVVATPGIDALVEPASWLDVYRACCCHSLRGWAQIALFLSMLLLLLYFFLVGLDLLGTAFRVVGGCTAGSLLGSDTSPLASVMIGMIATAILQSSSTTTSNIVSLVSGGLDVQQGIYMVMGANIGTSVTPQLVSLAHMGSEEDELERAFAGSSVLFIFNFMTVLVLFPLEVTTHYLYKLTKPMLPSETGRGGGEAWEGPIKKIVSPLVKKIIIANKDLIDGISTGAVESCAQVYPVNCHGGGIESYATCQEGTMVGVISCDSHTGHCPAFFQDGATKKDDMVSGWVCLVVALTIMIVCLLGLVTLLQKMLFGASTRVIYKATNINPYLAILIGCGVTVMVQSSSVTTSVLVPLAGVGVLRLENIVPLVMGADIGTTITALMAALVSSKVEALQIALCHIFFNVTGVLMWYPIPFLRNFVILNLAKLVGKATRQMKVFPILFVVVVYFVIPLLLLGISSCFEVHKTGYTALGTFLVMIIVLIVGYFLMWWNFQSGKVKFQDWMERRERRAAAIQALADDLDYLKVDTEWCRNEIYRIKDFAGHLTMVSAARMEEGRPLTTVHFPVAPPAATDEQEEESLGEDDRLSTFESCRSIPWKDIFYLGAESIRSERF
jgi:solute carrier family 34 (sodium-dependent phosphate cotransporter)